MNSGDRTIRPLNCQAPSVPLSSSIPPANLSDFQKKSRSQPPIFATDKGDVPAVPTPSERSPRATGRNPKETPSCIGETKSGSPKSATSPGMTSFASGDVLAGVVPAAGAAGSMAVKRCSGCAGSDLAKFHSRHHLASNFASSRCSSARRCRIAAPGAIGSLSPAASANEIPAANPCLAA